MSSQNELPFTAWVLGRKAEKENEERRRAEHDAMLKKLKSLMTQHIELSEATKKLRHDMDTLIKDFSLLVNTYSLEKSHSEGVFDNDPDIKANVEQLLRIRKEEMITIAHQAYERYEERNTERKSEELEDE